MSAGFVTSDINKRECTAPESPSNQTGNKNNLYLEQQRHVCAIFLKR